MPRDSDKIKDAFELHIVGGNAKLHGHRLARETADTYKIVLTRDESDALCLFTTEGEQGIIRSLKPVPLSTALKADGYMSMHGPAGKGEHKLELLDSTLSASRGVGTSFKQAGWTLVDDYGRLLLRHSHDPLTSRWIAARRSDGDDYDIWWYSPNAANMDDFDHYVAIDIEAVPVTSTGR